MPSGDSMHASKLLTGLVVTAALAQAAPPARVTILNGTRSAIVAIQVRPSRDSKAMWMQINKGQPVGIQRTTIFELLPNTCDYDVQAVFADGRSMNKLSQPFCHLPNGTYIVRG